MTIKVDAHKVRRLRDDLSRRLGFEVTQEYVAEKANITRALISYMENPKTKRRFSFETVFVLARYYREALNDPQITADWLAKELDRLAPRPQVDEDEDTYQLRQELIQRMYDKLSDLSPEQLETLDTYLDFQLSQQRHGQD